MPDSGQTRLFSVYCANCASILVSFYKEYFRKVTKTVAHFAHESSLFRWQVNNAISFDDISYSFSINGTTIGKYILFS